VRILRLSWRQLRRDLAAGELRILFASLVLAVMAVTAVGFLTDRAQRALSLEANRLLGGDAVLQADEPIGGALRAAAQAPGLRHSDSRSMRSMIGVGENVKLGALRAVEAGYPLRGRLVIERQPGKAQVAQGIPARGSVWMNSAGAQELSARVGDMVSIGESNLRLDAVVTEEPEAALDVFGSGPKVFMNLVDLPATALEQPGSRIGYRIAVAGEPDVVEKFEAQVRPILGRGQRLETAADARPEIRAALDRASRFLGLAALVSVVLAAIAVAMASRRHASRHLSGSAVMRCLGASQGTLVGIHVGELLWLGLAASGLGVLLAYLLQAAAGSWLAQALKVAIPAASMLPALAGVGVGLTVLLAFALPPVLALRRVPALRVLRRDLDVSEPSAWAVAIAGLTGLALLLRWKAGSATLGLTMLVGIAGTLFALGLLALVLIWVVRRLRPHLRGPWRYGLASVSRRPAASVAQISSLGLGLMVLLLLTFVRSDLLSRWQAALPVDAPNRFVINAQPEQLPSIRKHLLEAGVSSPEFYPMVRGRLVRYNGRAVTGDDFAEGGERARRLAEREFNLSFVERLRPDNEVVAGKFWPPQGPKQPEVSVEQDFAQMMGWKLGDKVEFDVAGQRLAATLTSLRKVDWQSFKPNFFVIGSPASLRGLPASYVLAVHSPPARPRFTSELVGAFPNLTVIEVDAVLAQVRATIDQVSAVVEAVFYFSLAAGVLVLLASVGASQDERLLEGAVMRVLGGSRRQLRLAQASEFAAIGLLSGLAAAGMATLLSEVVAREVFDLPFSADYGLVGTAALVGVLAAVIAGMVATRRVVAAPPSVTLRALQE
jgi:putative ABC transport system permease protein